MDPSSWVRSLPTKSTCWFDSPKVICFCWLLPSTMFDSGFQSPPAFFPPPFRTTYPLCKCPFSCPEPATSSWVPTTWKSCFFLALESAICSSTVIQSIFVLRYLALSLLEPSLIPVQDVFTEPFPLLFGLLLKAVFSPACSVSSLLELALSLQLVWWSLS